MIISETLRFLARKIEDVARLEVKLQESQRNQQFSQEEKDEIYCNSIVRQLNNLFETIPNINRQEIYVSLQIEEIESEENIYFAGIELKKLPDTNEKGNHYVKSGRPRIFSQKFRFIFDQQIPS